MEHQSWLQALWLSLRSIGVADLLDITVVSLFIYSVLLWFEWTKAAFVARGILILAALYILARQLGMVLTTWIFHGFFAIFVIALVIIFQEEIRRFFERLALWNFRRGRRKPLRNETADTLLQALSRYAGEKVGALIIVRGSDPLDRHLEGGVELDGRISGPLLQSLFDVHSDGHDGAVIIEDERVRRFGTHLPLSKNLDRLVGLGTRHAAALGLSEVTDAFCLVVSEQRGTISAAHNGDLRRMDTLTELEDALTAFLSKGGRREQSSGLLRFFRHKVSEKLIACGLSVVLWLVFVQGFKPETRAYTTAVQVQNVPDELKLKGVSPHRLAVTVSGLKRDLDRMPSGQVKVIVNAEGREAGPERVLISEDNIRLPEVLRFVSAEPPAVEIDLARAVHPSVSESPPPTLPAPSSAPPHHERI